MKSFQLFLTMVCFFCATQSQAALIDFTGVSLADVSSPTGQDFSYTVGSGPATGILNVRLTVGPISDLQTGESPDATGFRAFQTSSDLTPAKFVFSFDNSVSYRITENETLSNLETNIFTASSGTWSVLSSQNATVINTGPTISIKGTIFASPFGFFEIEGGGSSFQFDIQNDPGVGLFGSAISIDIIVPEPGTLSLLGLGVVVMPCLRRRRKHLTYVPWTQCLSPLAAFSIFALCATNAGATVLLDPSNITASTAMTPDPSFPIEEISDGITSDSPLLNGFVSPDMSGIVHLDFSALYDLQSFILHNDVNVSAEGIRDFRLDFFDASMDPITTTFSTLYTAPQSQFAPEEYVFPSVVAGVSRVDLVILNVNVGVATQTEIREVQFSVVPEPGTLSLLGLAAVAMSCFRRRRY